MAGFANEAGRVAGNLPSGSNPERPGVRAVVIESTNSGCSAQATIIQKAQAFENCCYFSVVTTGSVSWIALNNLNIQTENNSATTPGAGFMLHTLYDEHGVAAIANSILTGGNGFRFFAFVGGNGISSLNNHLLSHISSPFKNSTYA